MSTKYKRTNFYKQEIVNNKLENDLIKNYWELFKITRPLTFIYMSSLFLQRPDFLSVSVYQDISYWWIISKFNSIDDWWNDVQPGKKIALPDKLDIDDWYINILKVKQRS